MEVQEAGQILMERMARIASFAMNLETTRMRPGRCSGRGALAHKLRGMLQAERSQAVLAMSSLQGETGRTEIHRTRDNRDRAAGLGETTQMELTVQTESMPQVGLVGMRAAEMGEMFL